MNTQPQINNISTTQNSARLQRAPNTNMQPLRSRNVENPSINTFMGAELIEGINLSSATRTQEVENPPLQDAQISTLLIS
ncbi:23390_t:CDS:1, partial [Dentiscutata erythropus]